MADPNDPGDEWAQALAEQNTGRAATDSGAQIADEWSSAMAGQPGTPSKSSTMAAEWATMIDKDTQDSVSESGGGERILEQDEIDQMLGFTRYEPSAPGSGGVRAMVDSGIVSYERLPMLEIVFDRLVRLLSTSLRNFFQENVEVTLDSISSVRFGDFLNSIPVPVQIAVFRAETWENSGLVVVESGLAYSTFDLLLGGKRGHGAVRVDGRPFTPIEMQLVKRLIEVVLSDAEQSFEPIAPVEFKVDRIETNPRFASITRPANAALLIKLRLDMEGRGGTLQIVLPHATIEPIRDLLLQNFMGEKLGRDPIWEGHLATEVFQTEVPIEAVLHEVRLPLRRVLSLAVGDTIMFDARPSDLVTLRCGEWQLTQGRVGRLADKVAIQVARPLRRSRTTLDAWEANIKTVSRERVS